jgi:hypothetical protein
MFDNNQIRDEAANPALGGPVSNVQTIQPTLGFMQEFNENVGIFQQINVQLAALSAQFQEGMIQTALVSTRQDSAEKQLHALESTVNVTRFEVAKLVKAQNDYVPPHQRGYSSARGVEDDCGC